MTPLPEKWHPDRFEREYLLRIDPEQPFKCYCGMEGTRRDLIHERDSDRFHPNNKGKGPRDRLYLSHYEKCPKCKHVIFDEGQNIL